MTLVVVDTSEMMINLKKWRWNSVFRFEVTVEFFHCLVSFHYQWKACNVDVFCGVASLGGMLESVFGGVFFGEGV